MAPLTRARLEALTRWLERCRATALSLLCLGVLACGGQASAASCTPATSGGVAPADWPSYCWFDFTAYNDSMARSANGQTFTFTLNDGSTLSFVVNVTSTLSTALTAVTAPAWSGAAVGNTAFLGISGHPILYTAAAGTVNVQFSNITLTPPLGVTGGSTYSFVAADGESTNQGESLSFTTNAANWVVLDKVPPISGSLYPTIANTGTTFTETGVAGTVGGYILGSTNATTVSTTLVAGGLQGAMFALRYSAINLNKTLVSGRVNPSDQFTYKISATSSGNTLGTGTSSGTGNGPFSQTSSFVTTPQSLTVSESMAAGSVSTLASYSPNLTCTNATAGSTTPLPQNLAVTSYALTTIAFGDVISCVFRNTKLNPQLTIAKSAPQPGLKVGVNSNYTLTVSNAGPGPATTAQVKDQLPANLTFVSAAGTNWTCSSAASLITCNFSGATLAAGATSTIAVTVTAPPAAAGASDTNYASIDPTGGTAAPAPGPTCTTAGSCASAGPNVVVYINPVADTGTAVAGTAGTPIANVAANDTVNGAAALLSGAGANATVATVATWAAGIALNTATGAVTTSMSVATGVYSLQYQLCDKNTPPNCATVTDTVTVSASILPVADTGTAVAGTASTPIANVAANDSVNGAAALLSGAGANATVATVATWAAGIALNTATGAVTTTTSVAPGVYSLQYQLCDKNTPPDCATVTDTVTVNSAVTTKPNPGTAVAGIPSTPVANIAAGATVNGQPVTLGTSGNTTVAAVGTWAIGIALNTASGAVTTTAATPPGAFSLQYQLCAKGPPANCLVATDLVTVKPNIVPLTDTGSAVAGTAATPIANVAANDSVNGAAAVLAGALANATVSMLGAWPAGVALNANSGAITTTAAVPPGTLSLIYQLCDRNTPANCASVTDTIKITASIVPAAASGTAVAGTASTPIANVAANGRVDGQAAVLGPSGNATVATQSTWPAGIALNPATGAVMFAATVLPGSYSFGYQLCDKDTPVNCATATDTVLVKNSSGGTLLVDKAASKTQAEVGDSIQYRLHVRNTGTGVVIAIKLNDTLPLGFQLISGSVLLGRDGAVPAPSPDPQGAPGPALTWVLGNVGPGEVIEIDYRVRIAAGADRGDGINRAQALGIGVTSPVATAQVLITGGAFATQACVVGKIYVDCNGNRVQDAGEPGIPGVRLYFEDGTNLTSDENGNYSICGQRPITHVLKVDSTSLPAGSRLVVLSSRNAGDGDSLFVDLRDGELHRADFAEGSCTDKVMQDVQRRRQHGPVFAPLPAQGREHLGVDFESAPAGDVKRP